MKDRIDKKEDNRHDIPSEHPGTTSKENKEPTSSDYFHISLRTSGQKLRSGLPNPGK